MEGIQPATSPPREITATVTNLSNFQGTFNTDKAGFNERMPGHRTDHTMIFRQQPRTVKQIGAGIALPYETRLEMALMLDDHLCSLSVA